MMSNLFIRFPLVLVLSVLAGLAAAAPERDVSGERDKIERERARIEAVHTEQQRQCAEKFAVTSCADKAKRARRTALADLKRRSAALDEALRKQRAERRRQDINAKAARTDAPARAPAPRTAPRQASEAQLATPRDVRDPAAPPTPRPAPAAREAGKAPRSARAVKPESSASAATAGSAADTAARQAQEAKSRADFEARRQAAQAHLREVMERNAQRAASRAPAAPLPLPAASKP